MNSSSKDSKTSFQVSSGWKYFFNCDEEADIERFAQPFLLNCNIENMEELPYLTLQKIKHSLKIPFLQRKGSQGGCKENYIEELTDVINELMKREDELKEIIQIAKKSLKRQEKSEASYEKYKEKIRILRQKLTEKRTDIEKERIKNKEFKAEYKNLVSENKNLKTKNTELETEKESILKKICDFDKIEEDKRLLKLRIQEILDRESELIDQSKLNHESEQIILKQEIASLVEQLNQSKEKLRYCTKTEKKLESEIKRLNEELSTREEFIDSLVQKTKEFHEKELALQKQLAYEGRSRKFFSCMERTVESKHKFPLSLSVELDFLKSNSLTVENLKSVGVSSIKNSRKDTNGDYIEEFFHLLVQSVRINCPQFSDIESIPLGQLYERVLEIKLPFHMWYHWIKEELERIEDNQCNVELPNFIYSKNDALLRKKKFIHYLK